MHTNSSHTDPIRLVGLFCLACEIILFCQTYNTTFNGYSAIYNLKFSNEDVFERQKQGKRLRTAKRKMNTNLTNIK